MGKTIFWLFLFLTGSFLPAFASLLEKDSNASLDLHVRKKRIIDQCCDINHRVLNQEVPYVVAILGHHGRVKCTGIILAPHIVLTAAHCTHRENVAVASGIPRTSTYKFHTVVNVIVHDEYKNETGFNHDLALIVVREPIDIRVNHGHNRAISIYNGTLPPNSEGLISGWGCCSMDNTKYPTHVRSIVVPIINHQMCHKIASEKLHITEKHMCTLYPNREKCCSFGDSGGPLVYNGHLIGVFSSFHTHPQKPDVFMNLLNREYKSWVESWVSHIHHNSMHLQ